MIITKYINIEMGHRIPNHKSKCRNIHGHTYRVEVGVDGEIITKTGASNEGMVIDYGDLKEILIKDIGENFDHGFICFSNDELAGIFRDLKNKYNLKILFVPYIPTAENIAKDFFYILKEALEERDIKISYVKINETPTTSAVYKEE